MNVLKYVYINFLFLNFDSCYVKVVKFYYSFFNFFKFQMLHVFLVLGSFNINFCIENVDSSLPNGNANIIVVIICLLVLSISIINNKNSNSNNKPFDLDNINLVGNEEKLSKLILKNDVLVPKDPINFMDHFNDGGIGNKILVAIAFSLAIASSVYFTYQALKDYKFLGKKK
jgi:hypothetical protein